jgi:telomere length regulation protein
MDELLTPISTTYRQSANHEEPFFTEVKKESRAPANIAGPVTVPQTINSFDEALDALKSQPEYSILIKVLRFLLGDDKPASASTSAASGPLSSPSSKAAVVIQLLVTEIAPNYWTLLSEGSLATEHDGEAASSSVAVERSADAELFARCLRSITGLNALRTHMMLLNREAKAGGGSSRRPDLPLNISLFVDLLSAVLLGDNVIESVWSISSAAATLGPVQARGQLSTFVSTIASGRLCTTAAEAYDHLDRSRLPQESLWITDGLEYCRWIGRNLTSWSTGPSGQAVDFDLISRIFQQAMSFGYSG